MIATQRFLGIALLVSVTSLLRAQAVSPNLERGVDPQKAYAVDDVGVVNLFNGNLNVPVPIGIEYPVGGKVAYRLGLYYGGNSWETESREDVVLNSDGTPHLDSDGNVVMQTYAWSYPSRQDNAGIGWRLTLGRIETTSCGPSSSGSVAFASPDGGTHCFYSSLHIGRTAEEGSFQYTRDGSYLRLTPDTGRIESPDGMTYTYDTVSGGVTRIEDRFGNWVAVDYNATAAPSPTTVSATGMKIWRVSDSVGRNHYVYLRPTTSYQEENPDPDAAVQHYAVAEVRLQWIGGTAAQTWAFRYRNQPGSGSGTFSTISRPCTLSAQYAHLGGTVQVALLDAVTQPDGTEYEFDYHAPDTSECDDASALLTSLELPIGGKASWEYEVVIFPGNAWAHYKSPLSPSTPMGVKRRMLLAADGTLLGSRTYLHTSDPTTSVTGAPPPLEKNVVVTDFNGPAPTISDLETDANIVRKTQHFFSVCANDCVAPVKAGEYGLPLTRKRHDEIVSQITTADNSGYGLSSVTYGPDAAGAWIKPLSLTLVDYEADVNLGTFTDEGTGSTLPLAQQHTADLNRRMRRSRTLDGAGNCTDEVQSQFDGLGHYRVVTKAGTCGGGAGQVTTTTYNKPHPDVDSTSNDVPVWPWTWNALPASWILNTYSSQTTQEGESSATTLFSFGADGLLLRKRTLARGTVGTSDVISKYTYAKGNLTAEEYFGGDDQPVATSPLATMSLPPTRYRLDHTYATGANGRVMGVLATSRYWDIQGGAAMSFYSVDRSVDAATGLLTSARDTAAVETVLEYDALGRLLALRPAGRASTQYTYDTPNRRLIMREITGSEAPLTTSTYEYDSFGRLTSEQRSMPGGRVSTRETTYNVLGWRTTASELRASGNAPRITRFSYDALGRLTRATAPDGTSRLSAYTGDRTVEQFVVDAPAGSPAQFRSREVRDHLGRLRLVAQNPAAGGGEITTSYGYDAGGRLTTVQMRSPAGQVQNRIFTYDGRGVLLWEDHPESSMTSYTYDARGHVLTKNQSAANTLFDLKYTYDAAERLTTVAGRDPASPAVFRTIKTFEFATANAGTGAETDRRAGKLLRATRYNYPAGESSFVMPLYNVGETYAYKDAAGRRTNRTTVIERNPDSRGFPNWETIRTVNQAVTYDALSAPVLVTYPTCLDCAHSPTLPPRNLGITYDQARITALSVYVSAITYHANGMRHELQHTNLIKDTQTVDPTGMPRPGTLRSEFYDGCTAPAIVSQSTGGTIAPGETIQLWANMSNTATTPVTVQWFKSDGTPLAPAQDVSTTYVAHDVSEGGEYYVVLTNRCRAERSGTMRVVAGTCVAPSVDRVTSEKSSTGEHVLTADAKGTAPLTYVWTRRPEGTVLPGNGASITVAPAVTTEYSVTVTNACSAQSATGTVSVTIPIPVPTAVLATRDGNAVRVSWNRVEGATAYVIERFSAALGWITLGHDPDAASPFVDASVQLDATYAYRVIAKRDWYTSLPSEPDLATLLSFTPITTELYVHVAHFDEILRAVNALRATVGWAALSWQTILSPQDPVPIQGGDVTGRHIVALRMRMNEAMHMLGVRVESYTDPDPVLREIRAVHLTELQERTR